ncbi:MULTISPECIES: VOC family protein [Bacillota]|jgi:catechol 2,3-dioxygenase-like lactoylglutathione lyase family enzyme|uniref:VOC family protein n=2 Tax=Amedibacillus TaxID=2749846 RepID=A0A7G9GJM3_9FIRM|nr:MULTISPECIES: VOC family protein [Bacillota]QNM11005.1 VOC family protein [[Eubacterium] hominis]MCH4286434.1 VOC family protein [Amedibacillus hominis]RGB58497.1 VOC family protein [Absiella sp. AM22-9]RGB63385.1 VOC family protein [Absiella sp. AM10-20]RGB63617.1 VOC family protein [Absiella sp. AM09-45]
MKLTCTYISVKDMQKSIAFYEAFLNQKAQVYSENRFVQFTCGDTIALYNEAFDEELIKQNKTDEHFNEAYLTDFACKQKAVNTMVTFNYECEDLRYEYERLKKLQIGKLSDLRYVNIKAPYYYFTIEDPDGNELEVTGPYHEE